MELAVDRIIPGEKGRTQVRFDNGEEVVLYRAEIRKLGLEEGMPVTEEIYQTIYTEILGTRAKRRAMHLLERQDRTEKQLREKLRQNGYPASCINLAVEYVKQFHYVDDLRYAEVYVRLHQAKKSRQRLTMDLFGKGIPRELIEQALEEEYASKEDDKILEILRKRHYSFADADEKEQRKQYQYLMRHGFKSSDILKALKYNG